MVLTDHTLTLGFDPMTSTLCSLYYLGSKSIVSNRVPVKNAENGACPPDRVVHDALIGASCSE
eukprot:2779743-Amphidinium_carterae.1